MTCLQIRDSARFSLTAIIIVPLNDIAVCRTYNYERRVDYLQLSPEESNVRRNYFPHP